MRPRKLKINIAIGGMKMPIATVTIKKFADILKQDIRRICGKCGVAPKWVGGYVCSCCQICGSTLIEEVIDEKGTKNYRCSGDRAKDGVSCGYQDPSFYNHFSKLKPMLPDGTELVKEKLPVPEEGVEADAYVMDLPEFSKYADATLDEYGVIVKDDASARNIRKLLIAMRNLGKVILLHFNDTYEERVVILTTSLSNRIILKELIPQNLADIADTMRIDPTQVTEKDVQEAEAFIQQLPKAEESLLYVHDYRTKGIELPKVSPKVLELEAIISKTAQPQQTIEA